MPFNFIVCYARDAFPDHTDASFQDACLTETNKFRAKHHVPALHIDNKVV